MTDLSDTALSFSPFDRLFRHRAILTVSTVRFAGTETINGTTTYRLQATPDTNTMERGVSLLPQRTSLNVTNVSATYWIDTETMRPVRAVFEYTGEMTVRGQQIDIKQRIRLRFDDYDEPVSIRLPAAADTAVPIAGTTTTGITTSGDNETTGTTTEIGTEPETTSAGG